MSDAIQTKKFFRLFWVWQDEKEEQWLRRLAQQGWHLLRVGFLIYTFVKGDRADVIYKLDYQVLVRRDQAEYLGIFRDSGWEHVCDLFNWHYFRTPAQAGSNPDIFSDTESRIAKYRRILSVLVIFLPIITIGISNLFRRPLSLTGGFLSFKTILLLFFIAVMLLMVYAIVRLVFRISRLKRESRKKEQ